MIDHLKTINKSISELEKVVAMCTHHDIITGTCFIIIQKFLIYIFLFFLAKRYVINYYKQLLKDT